MVRKDFITAGAKSNFNALRTAYSSINFNLTTDLLLDPNGVKATNIDITIRSETLFKARQNHASFLDLNIADNIGFFENNISTNIALKTSLESNATLEFEEPLIDRYAISNLSANASINMDVLRTAYTEADLNVNTLIEAPSLRTAYVTSEIKGNCLLSNKESLNVLSATASANLIIEDNLDISFNKVFAYKKAIVNLESKAINTFKGTRFVLPTLDLNGGLKINPVPFQYNILMYGNWNGIAGTISAEGVLRLVPAPARRTFYVVPSARIFRVI